VIGIVQRSNYLKDEFWEEQKEVPPCRFSLCCSL
jgi:hypothetical protein